MMITKRLFSAAALATVIGFASCDNDDATDNNNASKEDAKASIASFNASAKTDLQNLSNTEGLKTIRNLFDLVDTDDPFGRQAADRNKLRHYFKQKGNDLKKIFRTNEADRIAEESFNFEDNLGIYTWNPSVGEAGEFERTGDAEVIEIHFPTEGSESNNALLTLKGYSEKEFFDEESQETYYEPTLLNADLYADDVKVASVYLEAAWNDEGFPLSASLVLSVSPYKLDIEFDDSAATSSYINISLLQNQQTLIGAVTTLKYKDSSKSEESLTRVEGYLQFKNLKVQGLINGEELNKQEINWNNVVQAALYDGDKKLGDIIHVDENGAYVPYLQYTDGSKEKLETVLQPVVDELENLKDDFESNS
ncbi:MAG TPA: hypothetical protein VIN08_22400 [Ohtaekwangia sp.]|uniref:hypothetical protein n=1 Tax=Ohtaekwangia sp. TaxID=2066019 RepID=UPI002F9479BF